MIEVFKDSFILINYRSENKGSGMELGKRHTYPIKDYVN